MIRRRFGFTLCLALVVASFPSLSSAADTVAADGSLTENQTLVSANEMFELGFFSPGRSGNWYLGIWYKNTPDRTVVWVANRDDPLPDSNLVALRIGSSGGNIEILDKLGSPTWSSTQNESAENPVLQLLGSGNLVLRERDDEDPENYIWQSFDHPTDTLLPDMKLGWDLTRMLDRNLTAWKSADDPGTGGYTFKVDFNGSPEIFLYRREDQVYRSGPWNGVGFSGVPEMKSTDDISFNFVTNSTDVYYSFTIRDKLLKSRLVVNASGALQRYTFIEDRQFWNLYWYAPKDQCDNNRECGPYGVCDPNASPVCDCAVGFEPKNRRAWELRDGSDGCVRTTSLDCSTDGFAAVKGMKLPDSTSAVVDKGMTVKECREACLNNCSCTAYASSDVSDGSGCVMWTTALYDLRHYSDGGQVLFVRLAASDLGSSDDKKKIIVEAVCITVGICILLFGVGFFLLWRRKTSQNKGKIEQRGPLERSQDFLLNAAILSSKRDHSGESQADELELPLIDFKTIVIATDNFSDENLLGQGGFGCVYKASLLEGEQVAVKRLSKNSGQGVDEFKNEVKLIARLQHRNLVRLLGCCVETDEKILIYELMENKSLDSIIFNPAKSNLLNWQRRFNIICGIARGLLYLHQDSRFRIIHRDLKASNILLDGEMDPKISDFGMARIFGGDQTEANTRRVVGTYGYMSPEYAMDGLFSIKSDVFSFGVLVLEIVSGKKNRGFYYANHELNLLGHAWKLWREGRGMELVDSSMGIEFSTGELSRCIHVGLLCVQEHAEDRPTMATVLLMLSSETATMPQPKNPGFCLGRNKETDSSSSKQEESCTVNQVTVTMLDAR